jgi:hypothetical protein
LVLWKKQLNIESFSRRMFVMELLWSFENLEDFTRHKNPLVRMWAFERLSLLYPQMTGDTAIQLITDRDDSISRAAIEYFVSHPDKRYVEGLLEAYGKSSGNMGALIANAIVNVKDVRIIHAFGEKYSSNDKHDLMDSRGVPKNSQGFR